MSWNNFRKHICKSLLKIVCKESPKQETSIVNKNNILTIWIRLPDIVSKGEHLLKNASER